MTRTPRKAPGKQPAHWFGELPTPERLVAAGGAESFQKTEDGRTAIHLNPVNRLLNDGRIDGDGYRAAFAYLADWDASGLAQRVTADTSRVVVDSGGHADAFEARRMDALSRFVAATNFVGQPFAVALSEMVLGNTSPTRFAIVHMGVTEADKKDRKRCYERGSERLVCAIESLSRYYAPPDAARRPAKMRGFIYADDRPKHRPELHDDGPIG